MLATAAFKISWSNTQGYGVMAKYMNVMLTINKLSLVIWKELREVEFYYHRSKIATTDNRHYVKPYDEKITLAEDC